ncbi:MAG: superoxide dismutase family protein [Planctomycetes bacterium]|nr:superoxide dismutase family protein [Planctomycetota bacterium]
MKKSPLFVALAVCSLAGMALAQEREAPQRKGAETKLKEEVKLPKHGVAVLRPTRGSDARGIVLLEQRGDALHLRGRVAGLSPGKHGFHIHEFGDIRDPEGESAGGHFDPRGHKHGAPGDPEHHAGDLGNIEANEQGVAEFNIEVPWLKLHYVVGRGLVVHGEADDLQSQPSGDAGPRVALGVIGIAQPPEKRQTAR